MIYRVAARVCALCVCVRVWLVWCGAVWLSGCVSELGLVGVGSCVSVCCVVVVAIVCYSVWVGVFACVVAGRLVVCAVVCLRVCGCACACVCVV